MISEWYRWLRTKCSRVFRRGKHEAALRAEMQFHLEQLTAENIEEGMSPRDARLAAEHEFGNAGVYREEVRDAWRPPEVADLWRSFRFAARSLMHSPGFTLIAVVTLALGIGANTAMFIGLDTILLKPLPYPESDQLDRIDRATPQNREGGVSPADFLDLQPDTQGYGEIAAYMRADTSLSEPGQPAEMIDTARISANLLSTLGVQPQLGRDFRAQEDRPGNDRVLIISQRCWQKRFGGSADIVGRRIRVDGEPHEIIGVMPASFNDWRHLGWVDLFRPLSFDKEKSADRRGTTLRLIGRRSAQNSSAQATGFIASFGERLAKQFPEVNAGSTWRTVPLKKTVTGPNGPVMLSMLVGLSGFVLLIACSNLANLFLARTMGRAREFAVRSALGASRAQLLRPLIGESLLLAIVSGACALVVAQWITSWLTVRSTAENGEQVIFLLDWRVFAWTLGASVITAVAFGLAPALFALRLDLNETLKSGGRGATGNRGHQRFRQLLIIAQFALAMILLSGATLFIRGVDELNNRRAGWGSEQLVTGTMVLPSARYPDAERIVAFHRLTLQRLEALPGVAAASISSFTPFFDWPDVRKYVVAGRELPQLGREPAAAVNSVSPRYFETVGTRVIAGRHFTERDTGVSAKVYIINQATANALFPNENPIGQRLIQVGSASSDSGEIVGVAADVTSVQPRPNAVTFQVYQPTAQEPQPASQIEVRTNDSASSASVVASTREIMTQLDPDLPVRQLQTADTAIERANYQKAVLRDMLTGFAGLGLALASLGIYGVIARTMAQRRTEFAIRFALGARISDVTRIVLTSGVKLVLIGSALGLVGAIGVIRLLAATNPGMHLDSAPALVGTIVLLLSVALCACWLPARRAARINPIEALRAE